ncbi:MAG TPA: ATP-binding protein, partial [Desulfobacterales bacterium]|nr:ATP-binding protein [Desulfobacterales bacterium]
MNFSRSSFYARLSQKQIAQISKIRSAVEKVSVTEKYSSIPFDTAERMIKMLESWLIDEEQKEAISRNSWNTFFMYALVYLKDIKRVEEHRRLPGITDDCQISIINDIINTVDNISIKSADSHESHCYDSFGEVRIDLLATVIALAEWLDLLHQKTLDKIHQCILRPSTDVRLKLPALFSVENIEPHPELPMTIRIQCKCRDAEVHRALKHYEITLNRFLDHLNKSIRPRFLYVKAIIEIEAINYEPIDLKFEVDTSAALELFTGNMLYNDKRVFLRELVQNAVDACNLRKLFAPNVSPSITISFLESENSIIIRDNGIGMDQKWLKKYFMNIGISFYRSDEFSDAIGSSVLRFDFISTFGIGFLSTFMVAKQICIRTRKPSEKGLVITITDFKDYFDVRPIEEDFPVGTEVTLILKPPRNKVWREMEYLGYLKTNLRFVPIPVHFVNEKGDSVVIGSRRLDFFDSNTSRLNFPARIRLPNSEGYLLLRTRGNQGTVWDLETSEGGL